MLRFFPSYLKAITDALKYVLDNDGYIDYYIKNILSKDKKRGKNDREFITEAIYSIIRKYRFYCQVLSNGKIEKDSDYEFLVAAYLVEKFDSLPYIKEFSSLNKNIIEEKLEESENNFKIRESIPDFLDDFGRQELSADLWEQEMTAQNVKAPLIIRANTLKLNSKEQLVSILESEQVKSIPLTDTKSALQIEGKPNLIKKESFLDGLFEIQDYSSQLVAEFLDPKAGDFVIDACAGAGGKSLHLASIMKNKGKILSLDIRENKLEELKRRALRAGVNIIETRVIKNKDVIKSLENSCDKLLLDVPCSGSGTLRRKPEMKFKLDADFFNKITQTQSEILENYSKMIKKGGFLLYSTCSILPCENDRQIKNFLDNNKNFYLVDAKSIFTSKTGHDGFYMALLKKKLETI